jgi:hypothetical protein
MQLQSVCHDTLPWLISFSLDLMSILTLVVAVAVGTVLLLLFGRWIGRVRFTLANAFWGSLIGHIVPGLVMLALGFLLAPVPWSRTHRWPCGCVCISDSPVPAPCAHTKRDSKPLESSATRAYCHLGRFSDCVSRR